MSAAAPREASEERLRMILAEEGQNQSVLSQHYGTLKQQLGSMNYANGPTLSRLRNHELEKANMGTISEEQVNTTASMKAQTTAEQLV